MTDSERVFYPLAADTIEEMAGWVKVLRRAVGAEIDAIDGPGGPFCMSTYVWCMSVTKYRTVRETESINMSVTKYKTVRETESINMSVTKYRTVCVTESINNVIYYGVCLLLNIELHTKLTAQMD